MLPNFTSSITIYSIKRFISEKVSKKHLLKLAFTANGDKEAFAACTSFHPLSGSRRQSIGIHIKTAEKTMVFSAVCIYLLISRPLD